MISMENTSHSREECYLRWNFTLDMEWYIRQLYVVFIVSNLMLKNSETKQQTQEGKKREGAANYGSLKR